MRALAVTKRVNRSCSQGGALLHWSTVARAGMPPCDKLAHRRYRGHGIARDTLAWLHGDLALGTYEASRN
jgi:hypothetical protein